MYTDIYITIPNYTLKKEKTKSSLNSAEKNTEEKTSPQTIQLTPPSNYGALENNQPKLLPAAKPTASCHHHFEKLIPGGLAGTILGIGASCFFKASCGIQMIGTIIGCGALGSCISCGCAACCCSEDTEVRNISTYRR